MIHYAGVHKHELLETLSAGQASDAVVLFLK